jgi:transmembrane sensor
LNTDTEVRVRFSDEERFIELLKGQAFFEVRREVARPFRVAAKDIEIEAVGTRFDVISLEAAPTRVLLAEGAVRVGAGAGDWLVNLTEAGDALLAAPGRPPELRKEDLESLTSWTAGRLMFRGTPLAQAVEEVNRYSRIKLELQGPGFSDAKVDGVFEAGDLQAFLSAVTVLFSLKARQAGERIVLTGG